MEATDRSDAAFSSAVYPGVAPGLARLAYELLDAHDDTSRLACALADDDERWAAHLAYLRDLQRVGRELLARAGAAAS